MDFMQKTKTYMEEYQSTLKICEASIRDLETQLSEMSKQLSKRPQVMFPSDTMVNSREQIKTLTPPQPTSSGSSAMEMGEELQPNEECPLGYATYEVPSRKSISIQIGNFYKDEFPKKMTKKQIFEDGVDYDKISPYASIPFPERLKMQRDEKESSKFLKVLESLREEEYLYDVEVEEWD
jgi:hypothetical protein